MSKLKAHLFVCTSCTYNRPDGTESSPEEAVAMRKNLKSRARECFPRAKYAYPPQIAWVNANLGSPACFTLKVNGI